jgi:hypothetical protein
MFLSSIRIDGGTQPRAEINEQVVGEYAEIIKAGGKLPPAVVFHDGAEHWLADGFHRYHAHRKAGQESIAVEIHEGTRRDAILYAVGANGTHGLRRSNEDKRKAVMMLLEDDEWRQWSDRKIAEACHVGHPLVAAVRAHLEEIPDSSVRKVERAGTVYEQNTAGVAESNKKRAKSKKQPGGQASWAPTAAGPAPTPAAAPDDAPEGFDPAEELESAHREIKALQEQIAALEADDKNAELAKQVRIRQATEVRLAQETDKANRLDKQLRDFGKKFERLRKLTGAKTNAEVVTIVERLVGKKQAA